MNKNVEFSKKSVIASLEELRKTVEAAMEPALEPIYKQRNSLKEILEMTDLQPTQRLILQLLSLSSGDVKISYLSENLGISYKALRINMMELREKGLVEPGFKYATWRITN
jgi:DNA-binding transcriptional ArsR family regulator